MRNKSFAFAVRTVKVCRYLEEQREYVLAKQLLRSGIAIGALVREAAFAESRADFVHKLSIARKEAGETQYWLELLEKVDSLTPQQAQSLLADTTELLKLLTSSIKTTKSIPKYE